jgi:molybdenum cofactor cytidylyltransferase
MLSKFSLIILGAGRAVRMGYPKGLIPFNNKTLVENHVETFLGYSGKKIILILGDNYDRYKRELPHLFSHPRIQIVINDMIDLGPIFSLQLGLKEAHGEGRFILPIDAQTPSSSTWMILAQQYSDLYSVVIPTHNNRGGHPVIISPSFSKKILTLDPLHADSRLDVQIRSLPAHEVKRVETEDEGILVNYNWPR